MITALPQAMMTLTTVSLGERRRDWALAMESEFEVALEEGAPLAFATGCLAAALRELPRHAEGRLVIAKYALALGLLLPMAVLLFGEGAALLSLLGGSAGGSPATGVDASSYAVWARLSAAPVMLLLWLSLGIAHLGLAWTVVAQDWSGVVKVGAGVCATLLTLVVLMAILFLDLDSLAPQAAAIAVELGVIAIVARSHARLLTRASAERVPF